MAMETFEKHPNAILDYGFDLRRWLTGTEIVTTVTATKVSGDNALVLGTTVTDGYNMGVMLSGGTIGARYVIRITGLTNANPARTLARDFEVFVTAKVGAV